jgi:hypothetical protein
MRKQLKYSPKAFKTVGKSYPSPYYALNEPTVNAFFAPGVKNISIHFDRDPDLEDGMYNKMWFINDGEPLSKDEINEKICVYGCESFDSAGNENGTGVKSFGSYFMNINCDYTDSFLLFGSKKDNNVLGVMILFPDCTYDDDDDMSSLSPEQRKFVEDILGSFTDGCVTSVYHSSLLSEEDIEKFRNGINNMFTTMLDNVNLKVFVGSKMYPFKYADRLYKHIDLGKYRVKEDNVTFMYCDKKFKCSYEIMSVGGQYGFLDKDELNDIDQVFNYQDNRGVHLGYDNGFFPISDNTKIFLQLLGLIDKESCYGVRGEIVAHPIEDNEEYAGVDEWKKFISEVGCMNSQKVPNIPNNGCYSRKKYGDNGTTLKKAYESFYPGVIEPMKDFINSYIISGNEGKKKESDNDFSEESLIENNKELSKQHLKWLDKDWAFEFKYFGEDEDAIKFEKRNDERKIIFNFFAESPLIKTVIIGAGKGKNGNNNLFKAVQPYVDTFKILIKDCGTSAGADKLAKDLVKKYNNFYS